MSGRLSKMPSPERWSTGCAATAIQLNGPSDHLLVPIDWLRLHLEKTRENNPATDQRKVEGRRWNAAVDEMGRCLDWYERKAREMAPGDSND